MVTFLNQLGLSEDHARLLGEQFVIEKKLTPGEFFLKEGKVSTEIGIVMKGMCRHFYNTQNGDATRWMALSGSFVVSLRSFISQTPAVENIQALEESHLAIMPRTNWLAIYERYEFARKLWTYNIEQNYIGMEERVFTLIAKSAEERYHWMLQHQPRFIQEVPDKYLASMLGITPRHLSRIRALRK